MPIKKIQWKAEYYGYLFIEWLFTFWSLESIYKFGEFLGSILFRLSPKYRNIVSRNLAIAAQNSTPPSSDEIETVFRHNGGNMLTTIAAGTLTSEQIDKHLTVHGIDQLEQCLQTSGVIMVLAHMGNWELLTKATDQLAENPPLGALYRKLNNPYMNDLILSRRENAGMTLIGSRRPAYPILKLLKNKGVMCILSDQRVGRKGTLSSFFGKMTPCTRLPFTIHDKTKSPIFTVSMVTIAPAKWELTLTRIEEPTQQSVIDSLALAISKSLPDCFWFQDRWQEFPHHEVLAEELKGGTHTFPRKIIPGIVESRSVIERIPELTSLDPEYYPVRIWDEGASPEGCYFAIGEGSEFKNACLRIGLKKGLYSERSARNSLTPR